MLSTLELLFYGSYIILVARGVEVATFLCLYEHTPNAEEVLLEEAGADLCGEKLDGFLLEPREEYLISFAIFHQLLDWFCCKAPN